MEDEISPELPDTSAAAAETQADTPISKSTQVRASVSRPKRTRARIVQIVSVLVLVLLLLLLWRFLGDRSTPKAAGRGDVVPVETALVTQQDVPLQIKAIGNVESLSTIAVRSQIEGTLTRVAFVPGQELKKGDLLFTIDSRPLQAQLGEAEANLLKAMAAVRQGNDIVAKDQATANNSRTILNRDARLIEAGVISREEYDNANAKLQADEATVRADRSSVANLLAAQKAQEAAVQNARVQLSYTTIRAP